MKLTLFFLSGIYWICTSVRNLMYDLGILYSTKINVKSIVVGNLAVGGTGKTPMVIFLANLLKKDILVSILSRGYKRRTKGFKIANSQTSYLEIGDESMQLFKRFGNEVIISVCENRLNGIMKLKKIYNPDIIILDDAYQHRTLCSECNILLTDYSKPYYSDYLLPYGTLRESTIFSKRANYIIITKCPSSIKEEEKQQIISKLKIKSYQKIYFSSILYGKKIISETLEISNHQFSSFDIILITGIANDIDICNYVNLKFKSVIHKKFTDHYDYSIKEIESIFQEYINLCSNSKIILTTEKDFIKLSNFSKLKKILFYLPIELDIHNKEQFIKQIRNYVEKV